MSQTGVDLPGLRLLCRDAMRRRSGTDGVRVDFSEWTCWARRAFVGCVVMWTVGLGSVPSHAQETSAALRARRFLAGRTPAGGASAAAAMEIARSQHAAMVAAQAEPVQPSAKLAGPRLNPLSAAWTAVGPTQVASQRYGIVSGRVTAVAVDPADISGNTVYVGTTGGGVWKSVNAAGPAAGVSFVPLTDTLPVFNANAGTVAIPSLSIGALSVNSGVVLAGTGDANDATDSYYGEGILRSVDGGTTWTLIQESHDGATGSHAWTGLGAAGFAWASTVPGLVVAAFSQSLEGTLVNASSASASVMGLYYSQDSGLTWQMATILDGSQVVQSPQPATPNYQGNAATAVVWNPVRQRFYAAVRSHGYYESVDGAVWTRMTHQPGTGLTSAACPSIPGTIATCPVFRGSLAVQPATGDTFALTVDATNQDQGLWQDVCAASGGNCSASTATFAKQLGSGPLEVSGGNTTILQGDYDLSLATVATGSGATADTLLFVGTTDLFRCSLAAGCVLRNTTNASNGCAAPAMVSPAQHSVAALAGQGAGGMPLVYLGNDGGLWRSVDGVNQTQTPCSPDDATHFQNLNAGLGSLAEVVSMAENPTDATTVVVGLGANGVASTSNGMMPSSPPWQQVSASEGGMVAIDPTNPQNWYVSLAAGVNIRWCSKGAGCGATDFAGTPTIGYAQVKDDASAVYPPFLLDPALLSEVLIGTCRVWRGPAQSGSSWPGSNTISTALGGPPNAVCNGATNGVVRSLGAGGPASGSTAAQNAGSTVLYAGMAGKLDGGGTVAGHVFANYAAGSASTTTVWTDVAKSTVTNDSADAGLFNPGGFDVSSVVVDAHDATGRTVYVTVMGFTGGGINAPHVYRSVDGGAHWLNISGNLPNAPANGLLVDPNDANTVYVALDTGIYVTTQVANCAAANCWSVFGTGLPDAPALSLAASAGLATGDGRFGELRVGTYGRGVWQIPLLTAAYPAAPLMTLSPVSLNYVTQAVGSASPAQMVTVTNTGNAALTISQAVTAGDFTETDTCAGQSIATGASCAVQVSFLPTATGTRTGTLTVYGNVAGGQATATLTGLGAPPAVVVLTPIMVIYPPTNVGSVSGPQNIAISNTGGLPTALGLPLVSGDFKISANTCGAMLGASVGCTVSVEFAPTASGARTGSLQVTDGAGTQTVSLSGVGVLGATDALAPLSLTFAQQPLNMASATQAVTLTNAGDAALTLIAANIASGDFTAVNGCGNSLNGHASCAIQVAFVPKSVGPGTGILAISDQFRTQTVTLSGVGVAPAGVSLSPVVGMTFLATGVGLASATQTVTLTNNGGLPLAIASLGVTGDFAIVSGTNSCGATLGAGAVCSAQVVFVPAAGGTRSGVLTVVDNAAGSPQTLSLTGTGIDFTLQANGPTAATISAGSQAVYGLLLTSAAGVPGTVTLTCAGAPAHATCTVNPASAGLGATSTVTVTVATSVVGAALRWPAGKQLIWLAGLVPLGFLALRRRRAAVLLGLLLLAGCGASRVIPGTDSATPVTPVTPTPPGTYNLVISGTSASLVRTVGLTLVVQ